MSHYWWTWVRYGVILAIIVGGHVVWFRATHDPAIGTRFGTALIALGIVVTARPFFRAGLRETVDRHSPGRLLRRHSVEQIEQQEAAHKVARPGIMHDVVAERIVGVAFIFFGTLFNGYGDLPLEWMGHIAK
jgi:hypothetical protein